MRFVFFFYPKASPVRGRGVYRGLREVSLYNKKKKEKAW